MSLNVLVVDDSAVVRAMIIKMLKMSGVSIDQVFQGANGQEGLDVLESNWIDLVLVDINMPVMNGEEMIDHVRDQAEWADLPIVVVSTEGSKTRIDRLIDKGVHFVHKPFTPEMICQIIQTITGICDEQRA